MNTFERQLAFGKAGESLIANWLKRRGYLVLPIYEKEISEGKGPQVFSAHGDLIAPDLLAFGRESDKVWWIEAKHKSAFSWHRMSGRWVTGIDLEHYQDYLQIQRLSPWPVWLLFLAEGRGERYPAWQNQPRRAIWRQPGPLEKMRKS